MKLLVIILMIFSYLKTFGQPLKIEPAKSYPIKKSAVTTNPPPKCTKEQLKLLALDSPHQRTRPPCKEELICTREVTGTFDSIESQDYSYLNIINSDQKKESFLCVWETKCEDIENNMTQYKGKKVKIKTKLYHEAIPEDAGQCWYREHVIELKWQN